LLSIDSGWDEMHSWLMEIDVLVRSDYECRIMTGRNLPCVCLSS